MVNFMMEMRVCWLIINGCFKVEESFKNLLLYKTMSLLFDFGRESFELVI